MPAAAAPRIPRPLLPSRLPFELAVLATVSAVLFAARIFAASCVGFGDSEALYAAYALHPQPAYLDHPGLIGAAARAIGQGLAPGPERAHVFTSVLSTLVPWAMTVACRSCGATWRRSLAAGLLFALAPEMGIGLFAMTPDLLLAPLWIAALAFAATGLGSTPGSTRAAWSFGAAGLLAGVGASAKVSGALLWVSLAVVYASRPLRPHGRTVAPWAGLGAGALVTLPILGFEAGRGWPMLHHRLVDSQVGAGISLRNLAALIGGQIAYLSPVTAVLVFFAGRALWRGRGDATGSLLFVCAVLPLSVLFPLCLWSHVAEPHWLAPGLLALVPAAARSPSAPTRGLVTWACMLGGAMVAATYAWVLVPSLLRFAPASYDPRIDLANELSGWPDVIRVVREEQRVASAIPGYRRGDVAAVGPHWVLCAQLEAALEGELPVGCDTPIRDDFDDWWPRDLWSHADVVLWVTDTRFPAEPQLARHATLRSREVRIERGGRVVRVFTVRVLVRAIGV
jgi:dolichyl-phosphate-mannose-protein mannosyltransferase